MDGNANASTHTLVTEGVIAHVEALQICKRSGYEGAENVLASYSAGDFMTECLKVLKNEYQLPESLQKVPGFLFWPIPLCFPSILANTLVGLEGMVRELREKGDWNKAEKLVEARKIFVQLSCSQDQLSGEYISDLSGDHCGVFLKDHPKIMELTAKEAKRAPWWGFCEALLKEQNPIVATGAISDNEDGSTAEEYALVDYGLIEKKGFFALHSIAENIHAELGKRMDALLTGYEDWKKDHLMGKVKHRLLYALSCGLIIHPNS